MSKEYQLTDEQIMLKDTAARLTKEKIEPRAAEIDESGKFPEDIYNQLKEMGLFGLAFPEEYGGGEAGIHSTALVIEEIARGCSCSAAICALPVVPGSIIMGWGTKAQKDTYLPSIVSGDTITAVGLFEDYGEFDTGSMLTRALKNGNHYVLNGRKKFVTLGDKASHFLVFAGISGNGNAESVSVFMIEKGTKGLSVINTGKTTGTKAIGFCDLELTDCEVPEDNLVGNLGDGADIMKKSMVLGGLVTAARAVGLAQGAFDYSYNYARERVQFGHPVASYQGIQFMISDMITWISSARFLLYKACADMDNGIHDAENTALMAKAYATDMAMKVTTDAVQLLGGYGFMKDYPVERMMRDAALTKLADGVNHDLYVEIGRGILEQD